MGAGGRAPGRAGRGPWVSGVVGAGIVPTLSRDGVPGRLWEPGLSEIPSLFMDLLFVDFLLMDFLFMDRSKSFRPTRIWSSP